ncbi:hypothetical protein ACNQKP_06880 [Bdellovibrio bacteriovorus]|uniref:hypothetical protein n=1 Tax=Bdellovibrio bacteriovorus TaxID=959 RepID=UPI003AA88274
MKILNQKGQALLEAAFVLPLLLATGTALAFLFYRTLIFYYADHQLHEALICAESVQVSTCRNHLEKSLQKLVLKNTRLSVRLNKSFLGSTGRVEIALQPEIQISKELRL